MISVEVLEEPVHAINRALDIVVARQGDGIRPWYKDFKILIGRGKSRSMLLSYLSTNYRLSYKNVGPKSMEQPYYVRSVQGCTRGCTPTLSENIPI